MLDFGGQYNQLIARRVRECHVYCEVHPYTLGIDKIKEMNPKGIIFTGGPNSVYAEESPRYQKEIFELGIPILGICYGSQLIRSVEQWRQHLSANTERQKSKWTSRLFCLAMSKKRQSAG